MKDSIDELYQIRLKSEDFLKKLARDVDSQREWELYAFLYERLSEEERKVFLEYIQRKGERQSKELKVSFECGFQTAVRLLIDGIKE